MPKSNGKLTKTVRFDPSLDVVFVEPSRSYGDDDGASTSQSPAPGTVRDRVNKYQRKHLHWPTPPYQRPPALPPRNEVVQAYAVTVEPAVVPTRRPPPPPPSPSPPPPPPPRRQRKYTLSVCRERLQRFTRNRNDQSGAAAELARRGDATAVAAIDVPPPAPHHRLTNQQAPPTKEKNKVKDKDAGKRKSKRSSKRNKRKRNRDEEGDADDEADESDDEGRRYKPGCLMSCLLFTIECMGCTIC